MVEIGGEIRSQGTNLESNKSWIIGIEDPTKSLSERTILKKIKLDNLSLATSGNYRKIQTDTITGEKYVHTIHPKTGKANKSNILSTTILTEKCIDADGYATALMLMNLEEGKAFLAQKPDLYGLIIYQDAAGEIQYYQTENITKLLVE
jgi:thiamine biosynthesis lipoprotein